MRLPPRGVCRLFLGGFFGQKFEVVFVNKQVDVSDFFSIFFCFVFGYIFSKLSQIPCFSRRVILMLFGVSCEVFIWKASKHEGFLHG